METGWLSPAGDFYPCPVYDHIATAMDILEKANHRWSKALDEQ